MVVRVDWFSTSNDEKLMLSVLRDLAEEKARLWQESRRRGDISKLCSLSWLSWWWWWWW